MGAGGAVPGGPRVAAGLRLGKRRENNVKKHRKSTHGESLRAEERFPRRVVAHRIPGAVPEEEEEAVVFRLVECFLTPRISSSVQNGSVHQKDGLNDDDFEPYLSPQARPVSELS